jgi:hypothetical protein|tara:strand:- start:1402 stop:2025 length:624 start_codon:yes stop_codon:yes gene_type:complete
MTVFRKTDTFDIFKQCVDYNNESILDFGGNRGNLLTSSNGIIQQNKYTCLDISQAGLAELPENTKAIHWNRYHSNYNPTGNINEPFPKIKYHDIIFANSVFTHHTLEEMLYCIDNLSQYTNRLVFTYIDPFNKQFLEKFKEKYYDLSFEGRDVSYTTDKNGILWSAFDTEYLKKHLSYHRIEVGTTNWFNYIDIQVRLPVVASLVVY